MNPLRLAALGTIAAVLIGLLPVLLPPVSPLPASGEGIAGDRAPGRTAVIIGDAGRAASPLAPAAYAQGAGAPEGTDYSPSAEQAKSRSRFHYLMLGYGLIWVCLGVFLFDLSRKIGRVGSEIDELKARLDATEVRARR